MQQGLQHGEKMNASQIKHIQDAGKYIYQMIQEGFVQGKLSNQERGRYGAKLLSEFTQ